MKYLKSLAILSFLLVFASCGGDDEPSRSVEIPEQFSVDIPTSLSSESATPVAGRVGATQAVIEGEDIYEALRYYIHIAEESAEVLELTLQIGSVLEQNSISSLVFEGDDDSRQKRIDLVEGVTRGGVNYAYEMTLVDLENEDLALQILWNTNPVSGIAILRPAFLDRTDGEVSEDLYYRIDYTEDHPDYEQAMTVSISGANVVEQGDPDNLKMFAGRNGDIVEVMGNSNHPNLEIIDPDFTGGRNYAFVGRGDDSSELGVVNLWLPASNVATNDFVAGDANSVYAVLEAEINAVANLDEVTISAILAEAGSPAYFNTQGFIAAGSENQPMSFSNAFVDLSGMTPFVPNDIKNLSVRFIQ